LTSSPKGIPARGHVASKFRVVANLQPGHVSGWQYVAVVVIITVARRDGGPLRGCVVWPNCSGVVDVSVVGAARDG